MPRTHSQLLYSRQCQESSSSLPGPHHPPANSDEPASEPGAARDAVRRAGDARLWRHDRGRARAAAGPQRQPSEKQATDQYPGRRLGRCRALEPAQADAGHALEQVLGFTLGGGPPDGVVEVPFQVGELALERLQEPVDALDHAAIGEAFPPAAPDRHHLDNLTPAGDHLAEGAGLGVRLRPGFGADRIGKAGDDCRIEGVGLGKSAGSAGDGA